MKTLFLSLLLPFALAAQTETAFVVTTLPPVTTSPDNLPAYLIPSVTLVSEKNTGDSITFALNRLGKVILTQHGPQKPMPANLDATWEICTETLPTADVTVWRILAPPYNLFYVVNLDGSACLRMTAGDGPEMKIYCSTAKK